MKKQLFLLFSIFLFIGGAYSQVGLNFDGNEDYLTTDFPGVLGNNPITIEAWVKTNGENNEQVIAAWGSDLISGGRFTFRLNKSGTNFVARVEIKGGGLNGTINVDDGNWHHVAVTYDPSLTSNKYKLFVDGVLDAEGSFSQNLNVVENTNMVIGKRINVGFGGYFNGGIDDLRVWDVAKSEADILANMNAEICTQTADLVAYYSFNEGVPNGTNTTIDKALDLSSNLGSATFNGFQLTGNSSNYVVGPTLTEGLNSSNQVENSCETYTWTQNGTEYTNSGTYTEITTGSNGCDSIIILDLTIHQPYADTVTETSCGEFVWSENGMTYTNSGEYTEIYTNQAGCDSIITLDLTVSPLLLSVTNTNNGTLTADQTGATYQWLDCNDNMAIIPGETASSFYPTTSGDYAVEVSLGDCTGTSDCETVTVSPNSNAALNFNGNGDYLSTDFPGVLGNNPITVEAWVKTNGVNGEQVITAWGNDGISGGRFTFRLNNVGGDFVTRIENKGGGINGTTDLNDGDWHHVAVTYDPDATSNKYTLYVDGVVDVEGDISQPLNVSSNVNMNIGRRINTTYAGYFNGEMDDVRVWNVVKTQTEIADNLNHEICTQSENLVAYYNFNEGVPNGMNTGIDKALDLSLNLGSASFNGFELTGSASNYTTGPALISGLQNSIETESACGDYTWAQNGATYTISGQYFDITTGTNGCDSIIILDLEIIEADSITITEVACEEFTWTENGTTYTASGLYSETYMNQVGCDSIVTLDLTISAPTSSSSTETACDEFVWSATGNTLTSSGEYTETLTSVAGCDSIVTLNLTITTSDVITITESACDSFTWEVNGTTYSTSGQYVESFMNQAGCDSIITLDLTIGTTDSIVLTEDACDEFTWEENGTTYTTSGEYTEILTNASGCDSVLVLDLTIHTLDLTVTDNNGTLTANQEDATYQWYDCTTEEVVPGAESQEFEPTYTGGFAVIIDNGTCVDTSDCIEVNVVSIDQYGLTNFALYPNPSEGEFVIAFNQPFSGSIKVFDVTGKIVYQTKTQESEITNINLINVENGMYFVNIEANSGERSTRKVIIE